MKTTTFLNHFNRANKSRRKNQFEQNKYFDIITGRQLDPVIVATNRDLREEITIVKRGGWSVIFPDSGIRVSNKYEYRLFPGGKTHKVDEAEILDTNKIRHCRRFVNGVMQE